MLILQICCRQPEGLKRDLQIWSAGLFPFFQYASTSVKVSIRFFP